jgi:ATP-binding cassette subfamily B protein
MKNIIKIVKISKPLHKLVLLIGVLILTSSLMDLVAPILSKYIVDEIVAKTQHNGGNLQKLIVLIVIALGINLVSLVITTVSDRLGDHFAGRLRKFLTEKFFDKVLTLPQTYFDTEISGKIVHQLNRGIMSIQNFINSATNFILPTFLQSVFTIVVLAYYNLPIAFFTLLLFPVYLTLSYYSSKQWGKYEVEKNKIEDTTRGRIQEVIGNIRLVKSFITEKEEYRTLSHNLTASNKIYAVQSRNFHIFDFFRGFSLNLVLFVVNIIVFYQTYTGVLTIGTMVLILQLVAQARRPLFAMSFILTNIQQAESGSKEYFEILDLKSTENYRKDIEKKKLTNPTISFEHVNFSYEASNIVLQDVSFSIKAHESVALVGHSGAGKSTIINLILKFYDPTSGKILLKDQEYQDLDHALIRNNIALVFQENELFSSTIRENVAYGTPDTSDEDVIRALKLAYAYDFVEKLPEGINSEVGERGVRLSGGQKQRIQIARAILKDAPVLILDEATSSLDAKSEKEVQNALENLMKNRLVIIIAHRFSTIQNVDTVIVIDSGKIVDTGAPKDLSTRPGIYSTLLNYQIEGNKKLLANFDIY